MRGKARPRLRGSLSADLALPNTPTRAAERGASQHLDESILAGLAIGDLSGEEHARALEHLERCPRCREAAAAVQQGDRTRLSGVPTEPAMALPVDPTLVTDPLIGTQLGEYAVTGLLARGGMGAIYSAVQPMIGRKVAIKVLLSDWAGEAGLVDRLLDEARALAAIRHPNIVDVFGFGTTPAGQQYFVMDFLEGETLSTLLRREGKVPPHHVLTILEGILAGLDAAHRTGVLHRDLKPGNVFLVPLADGSVHVKLLDFGLVKQLKGPSRTGPAMMLGTPGFMAPEQICGEPLSERTDLYAVGVMAFALLSGQNPFPAEGRALLEAHLDQVAPRVGGRVPDLPEGLDALVAQLLEKRPEHRPASALEARREVQRIRRRAESAPTLQQGAPLGALSNLVQTRQFPAIPPALAPALLLTRNDRPAVELELAGAARAAAVPGAEGSAGSAPRSRWRGWALGALLVLAGFGAGLVASRLGPSRADVEGKLAAARASASALEAALARAAATAELEALEKRLAAGESPETVARDLEQAVAAHRLGKK